MSKAQLIISQPGLRTRRVEITKKLISIGRKTDNTIALEGDTNVSKYHAVIELRPDGFWLSDLGSSNGTTVNRQPVRTELKLTSGDLICVGGTSTVEFVLPDGATPPADESAADAPPAPQPPTPAPPTAAAAPPVPVKQSSGTSPLLIAGIVGGLVIVVALVALLFATGAIGSSGANKNSSENANAPSSSRPSNTTTADEFGGGDTNADHANGGAGDAPPSGKSPASGAAEDVSGASPDAFAPPSTQGVESADASAVGPLARTLAAQIGQKSVYSFDPAFVNLIKNYTNEYRTAAGYSERARKYRDAVEQEFVNVQGIQPPLIGYVMALSRSKFNERAPGGVWGLPASASNSAPGGPSDASDPAASTRAAAVYMKELLDLFGRDQFMYAVACYGMTLDEAGKVKTDLESKDTTGQMRYDFWKMKNAGVVRGEQVERVARFFAAGIVGENPQAFGLQDKPLSSLYDL